jgi:hypothetical protein
MLWLFYSRNAPQLFFDSAPIGPPYSTPLRDRSPRDCQKARALRKPDRAMWFPSRFSFWVARVERVAQAIVSKQVHTEVRPNWQLTLSFLLDVQTNWLPI